MGGDSSEWKGKKEKESKEKERNINRDAKKIVIIIIDGEENIKTSNKECEALKKRENKHKNGGEEKH